MSALVNAGRLDEACEVLDWMADSGVAGNAVVYQTLINAFLEREQQDKVGGWVGGLQGLHGVAGLGEAGWLAGWLGSAWVDLAGCFASLSCQYWAGQGKFQGTRLPAAASAHPCRRWTGCWSACGATACSSATWQWGASRASA